MKWSKWTFLTFLIFFFLFSAKTIHQIQSEFANCFRASKTALFRINFYFPKIICPLLVLRPVLYSKIYHAGWFAVASSAITTLQHGYLPMEIEPSAIYKHVSELFTDQFFVDEPWMCLSVVVHFCRGNEWVGVLKSGAGGRI